MSITVSQPVTTRQPKKRRGLKMAETRQHAIVLRRAAGETKSSIAKSMGISRETVARVLSQGEFQELVQKSRSELINLLPRAAGVLRYFLNKKHPTNKSADVALKMMEGLQVLIPKSRVDVAPVQAKEFEGWTTEQLETYIQTGKRPGDTGEEY